MNRGNDRPNGPGFLHAAVALSSLSDPRATIFMASSVSVYAGFDDH
jgi:hypothetical protein